MKHDCSSVKLGFACRAELDAVRRALRRKTTKPKSLRAPQLGRIRHS